MGACFSNMLIAGEKLALWFVCTSLVWCLVLTIITVLGFGVGLGYNYCFVDMKTRYKYVPAHIKSSNLRRHSARAQPNVLRTIDDDIKKLDDVLDSGNLQFNIATPPMINIDVTHNTNVLKNKTVNNNGVVLNETIRNNNLTYNFTSNDTDEPYKILIRPKSLESILNSKEVPKSLESILNSEEIPKSLEPILNSEETQDNIKKSILPITGLNLIDLLSKLRDSNRNYTLQIVEA